MTTVTKHITERPHPLRQRAPDRKIPAYLEMLVLQMLEKDPAGRPQSMSVVEAMLCDAQIGAKVQTEWDDLEIPDVDETWRKKLTEGMPSPRSRRLRRLALILGAAALVGIGSALFFGLRRPKEIITYTPVYVEVTKTDEAETVAPFLRKASVAAESEHYFNPAETSALRNIELAEKEAMRLGTVSGGAASLRRIYGNQFRSLGNALLESGLSELAVLRYREAIRFLPNDPDLRARAGSLPETKKAEKSDNSAHATPTAKSTSDDAARLEAANLFAAVAGGRFSQARPHLAKLIEVDTDRIQIPRLADQFRKRAEERWEQGKRSDARLVYQILSELDPKDPVAEERARSEEKTVPSPAELATEQASTEGNKSGKKKGNDSSGESSRDRAVSAKFAKEGHEAFSQGNLSRAESAFDKAVRADATNPDAVAGLAEVAFERAKYTDALDYARRAVAFAPKVPRYFIVLGDSYFKLLRYDEALSSYERALKLAPSNDGIKARIDRVRARLKK